VYRQWLCRHLHLRIHGGGKCRSELFQDIKRNQLKRKESKEEEQRELQLQPKPKTPDLHTEGISQQILSTLPTITAALKGSSEEWVQSDVCV